MEPHGPAAQQPRGALRVAARGLRALGGPGRPGPGLAGAGAPPPGALRDQGRGRLREGGRVRRARSAGPEPTLEVREGPERGHDRPLPGVLRQGGPGAARLRRGRRPRADQHGGPPGGEEGGRGRQLRGPRQLLLLRERAPAVGPREGGGPERGPPADHGRGLPGLEPPWRRAPAEVGLPAGNPPDHGRPLWRLRPRRLQLQIGDIPLRAAGKGGRAEPAGLQPGAASVRPLADGRGGPRVGTLRRR
mmetsp:Transcript_36794/g.102111  ORF Transcript_36794/g.102111 Transcript_36794/m.102111 type:complete len:247 (+) Transcript_36794:247-987(+)